MTAGHMEQQQYERLYAKLERMSDDVSDLREKAAKLEAHMQHLPTEGMIAKAIQDHMNQCVVSRPKPSGGGSFFDVKDPAFLFKLLTLLFGAGVAVLTGLKIF